MRRGLVHGGAWVLATGAATALSWFGVHSVLAGGDDEPPRAMPVASGGPASPSPRPPSPSPSPSPSASATRGDRPSPAPSRTSAEPSPPGRTSSSPHDGHPAGNLRAGTVTGGRAVFDMGEDSASLVSATPEEGWTMRVWKETRWIRVTFSRGGDASTVFCRWDDGPPRLETFRG